VEETELPAGRSDIMRFEHPHIDLRRTEKAGQSRAKDAWQEISSGLRLVENVALRQ
jgi:hypothetical protein